MTLYSITVKGNSGDEYSFNFEGDEQHLDHWRDEGFIIDEIVHTEDADIDNLIHRKHRRH